MSSYDFVIGILWYLVFIVSTSCHEAAHAFIAKKLGDPTASDLGLSSFDPLPHMRREPFGMILMPLLSVFLYGWPMGFAHIPVDANWADRNLRESALVSLAGPMANFMLALVSFILIKFGIHQGYFNFSGIRFESLVQGTGIIAGPCALILSIFFCKNLIGFLFNLLPLAPLDGSQVVTLFMTKKFAWKYLSFISQPMVPMATLFIAWNLFPAIFSPFYFFTLAYF